MVPLVPRRRIAGLPFGDVRSVRRGGVFDTIGSRPYRPGDDLRRIDRHASARLTAASDEDTLIVREHHAEERLTVALAVDPSPTMALCPDGLPWLRKPEAVAAVERIVAASSARSRARLLRLEGFPPSDRHGRLGTGSLVFAVSDYLAFPADEAWEDALAHGWDLVPVVVQDPTWEQSFPDVGGVPLAIADAEGTRRTVLLARREVSQRRVDNEARLASIVERLENLGLEPIVLGSADLDEVLVAMLAWAEARRSALAWSG